MNCIIHQIMSVALILSSSLAMADEVRRIDMNFGGQLDSAVRELREKIASDPDLTGRRLRLGKFSGPYLPDSTFDVAFEHGFRSRVEDLLSEESEFIVSGEFDLVEGTLRENNGLEVIQFVIEIRQKRRKLLSIMREINNSVDIVRISGATVKLPDQQKPGQKRDDYLKDRNEAASKAAETPDAGQSDYDVQSGTRICAKDAADYGVEILTVSANGTAQPVTPRSLNGRAFVDIEVGQKMIIKVYNGNLQFAANARITIDGLDVANTFSEDQQKYAGYSVPKATSNGPGSHAVPGWLITTSRNTQNVYQFVVNKLGEGAATEMNSRHRLGVIQVEFFLEAGADGSLPRGHGEIGRGQQMDVGYSVKQVKFRDSPVSIVSVRYANRE